MSTILFGIVRMGGDTSVSLGIFVDFILPWLKGLSAVGICFAAYR